MHMPRGIILVTVMALSACGGGERDITLRSFQSTAPGPDEFTVIPGKSLEAPKDFANLPTPTPGGSNLTDQNPLGDAVAALGGKPKALVPSGVARGDGTLVSHASRFGVQPDIRASLAAEDLAFRTRKARFTKIRIAKVDRYVEVYARQSLDAHSELARFRRAGVRTPTAPPKNWRP